MAKREYAETRARTKERLSAGRVLMMVTKAFSRGQNENWNCEAVGVRLDALAPVDGYKQAYFTITNGGENWGEVRWLQFLEATMRPGALKADTEINSELQAALIGAVVAVELWEKDEEGKVHLELGQYTRITPKEKDSILSRYHGEMPIVTKEMATTDFKGYPPEYGDSTPHEDRKSFDEGALPGEKGFKDQGGGHNYGKPSTYNKGGMPKASAPVPEVSGPPKEWGVGQGGNYAEGADAGANDGFNDNDIPF